MFRTMHTRKNIGGRETVASSRNYASQNRYRRPARKMTTDKDTRVPKTKRSFPRAAT